MLSQKAPPLPLCGQEMVWERRRWVSRLSEGLEVVWVEEIMLSGHLMFLVGAKMGWTRSILAEAMGLVVAVLGGEEWFLHLLARMPVLGETRDYRRASKWFEVDQRGTFTNSNPLKTSTNFKTQMALEV